MGRFIRPHIPRSTVAGILLAFAFVCWWYKEAIEWNHDPDYVPPPPFKDCVRPPHTFFTTEWPIPGEDSSLVHDDNDDDDDGYGNERYITINCTLIEYSCATGPQTMTTVSNTTCFPPGNPPETEMKRWSTDGPLDPSLTFYSENGTVHRIEPSADGPLEMDTPFAALEEAMNFDVDKRIASMAEIAYDNTTWGQLFAVGWFQTVYCSLLGSMILRTQKAPKFRKGRISFTRKEQRSMPIIGVALALHLANIWWSFTTMEEVIWLSFRSTKDARRWAALGLQLSIFASTGSVMAWFGDGSRKVVYSYG